MSDGSQVLVVGQEREVKRIKDDRGQQERMAE